jgi:hypothetical protein
MRMAVDCASGLDSPDFGIDADMFAREIVCVYVLFRRVIAVQIPSLDLGSLCEFIGSRHD